MDTTQNRKFTGVFLPAWVMDMNLPTKAEKLYCIILALQGGEGCFASSQYLGDSLGCSRRQAQEWIKYLTDRGLVRASRSNGRQRWLVAVMDNPSLPIGDAETRTSDVKKPAHQLRGKPRAYNIEDSKGDKDTPTEAKPPAGSIHSIAKDIFKFHYQHWVEAEYPYWDGKDAGGLSRLLKQVRTIAEAHRAETKPDAPPLTDVELLDNFDAFLTKVGLLGAEDEFIINNFSPAFISGSFNKLVTTLRNKANGNYKERLRQTRAALRANDRAQQWGDLLKFAGGSAGAK